MSQRPRYVNDAAAAKNIISCWITSLTAKREGSRGWGTWTAAWPPPLKHDLVRLTEHPYSDQCWMSTKACAYDETTLLIAVRPELLMRAPEVAGMLRKWELRSGDYRSMSIWRTDAGAQPCRRRCPVAEQQPIRLGPVGDGGGRRHTAGPRRR